MNSRPQGSLAAGGLDYHISAEAAGGSRNLSHGVVFIAI